MPIRTKRRKTQQKMHVLHIAAIIRVVAIFLNVACSLILALLLLRLHMKMAQAPNLEWMRDWTKREQTVTIVVVVLFAISFILMLTTEALILSKKPSDFLRSDNQEEKEEEEESDV